MPLISVIIPAYNCEPYILRSIQSVLSQPLADQCEIIVVNDGSTDNTEPVCRRCTQEHTNITLITQENQGASAARNRGIDAAQGDYIMFLDADDAYVDGILGPWLLKELNQQYDVLLFSAYTSNTRRNRYGINIRVQDAVFPGGRPISFFGTFASCMYRRDLLIRHSIRFMENVRNNEDQVFNLQTLYFAKTIRACKEFCYIYCSTPHSTSRRYRRTFDFVIAWQQAYEWFNQHAQQNRAQILSFCRIKVCARMLLYASNYAQRCLSKKALLRELERVHILSTLQHLTQAQILPYQTKELYLFQHHLNRFMLHAHLTGAKISIGRFLLEFSPIRSLRDRKIYPYTHISVSGPE